MAMGAKRKACVCDSGAPYSTCCGPLHRGVALAASPLALMRSRYAAFALGCGAYLYETLATGHPDRVRSEVDFVRALAGRARRFMGLRIFGTWENGDHGEVLFAARIFERGKSVGIVELSRFELAGGRWLYADGVLAPLESFTDGDLAGLSREGFLERVRIGADRRGLVGA